MGYRGWHGVCDPKAMLIAVGYEPVEGSLVCLLKTGEPVIHLNVPENIYQILLRSKFAGSYYRKYVRGKYKLLNEDVPDSYLPFEPLPDKKLAPVKTVPDGIPDAQMGLFPSAAPRTRRSSRSS